MGQNTGYGGFLQFQNDEELTEQELLDLENKQREAILNSLDQIRTNPYKTESDVADYIRYQGYLTGDESLNLQTDEQIIDSATAFGHPMVKEIYEPTIKDIANLKLKQNMIRYNYDMPAYVMLGFRGTDIANEFPEGHPAHMNPEEAEKNYFDTKAFQLEQAVRMANPTWTNEQVKFQVEQAKTNGAVFDSDVRRLLEEGKTVMDEYIKNNPKARATLEWMSQEKVSEIGFGKWSTGLFLDVFPSIVQSQASGRLTSMALGKLGAAAGPKGAVIGAVSGQIIGSGISGALMEGGAYLREEWERLTRDEQITKERFLEEYGEAKKYYEDKYKGNTYDEELKQTMNAASYLDLWMKNNYVMGEGQIIRKGLGKDEAVEAVAAGAHTYALAAGFIEQISGLKYIADISPAASRYMKKNGAARVFLNMSKGIEDRARLIPKTTALNRAQRYLWEGMPGQLAEMAGNSIEEVLQGGTQAIITAHGPSALEDVFLPNTTIREQHGGWTQIRDEAAGGIFGSAPMAIAAPYKAISGINEKQLNKGILKSSKTKTGSRFAVELSGKDENGNDIFSVANYLTEKDEDTGEINVEKKTDLSDMVDANGETFQTSFDNFHDAFEAAQTFTKQEAIVANTQRAWQFKDIRKGSTNVIENEDGTFGVEILNNDGEVFRTTEETFNKKWKANRAAKKFQHQMDDINDAYEKYGVSKGTDNAIIKQYEKKKNVQMQETIIGMVKDAVATDASMGIAAFMTENVEGENVGPEARESYDRAVNEEGILTNPDTIIRHVQNDTDNAILTKRGHTPDKLLQVFDEMFGPEGQDISNYKSKRKELVDALGEKKPLAPPDVKKTTTEEGPTTTEQGPPVETGEGPGLGRPASDIGVEATPTEVGEGPPVDTTEVPEEKLLLKDLLKESLYLN